MPHIIIMSKPEPIADEPYDNTEAEQPEDDGALSPEKVQCGQDILNAFSSRDPAEVYRAICDLFRLEDSDDPRY